MSQWERVLQGWEIFFAKCGQRQPHSCFYEPYLKITELRLSQRGFLLSIRILR